MKNMGKEKKTFKVNAAQSVVLDRQNEIRIIQGMFGSHDSDGVVSDQQQESRHQECCDNTHRLFERIDRTKIIIKTGVPLHYICVPV